MEFAVQMFVAGMVSIVFITGVIAAIALVCQHLDDD